MEEFKEVSEGFKKVRGFQGFTRAFQKAGPEGFWDVSKKFHWPSGVLMGNQKFSMDF